MLPKFYLSLLLLLLSFYYKKHISRESRGKGREMGRMRRTLITLGTTFRTISRKLETVTFTHPFT